MFKNILIIDDDIMNLKMAKTVLERAGYKVDMQKSGALGIKSLKENKTDLVLLDIEMPDMDGIQTLENIRMEKELEEIPVIFITASGDTDNVVQAAKLGVADYVKKPFLMNELLKRVAKVFDGKK